MKQLFVLMAIVLCVCTQSSAQDKDVVARMHYMTAEEYYNGDSTRGYRQCIGELNKAENVLGSTNAKIMELKTRAWTRLTLQNKNITNLYIVDSCMKQFFALADSKSYPQERYMEMVRLKNDVQAYKESLPADFAQVYLQDYSLFDDMHALFDINKNKMKSDQAIPFVSFNEPINATAMVSDTLHALFELNDRNYYALPFKTGSKGGYLFWFFSSEKIGSWYMAYRNKEQELKNVNSFFRSFNQRNAINVQNKFRKKDIWPNVIIQNTAVQLEPNTEYYIWLSSNDKYTLKETLSIPIYYALYLTDDDTKTWKNFFDNKANDKVIRSRGYENNQY